MPGIEPGSEWTHAISVYACRSPFHSRCGGRRQPRPSANKGCAMRLTAARLAVTGRQLAHVPMVIGMVDASKHAHEQAQNRTCRCKETDGGLCHHRVRVIVRIYTFPGDWYEHARKLDARLTVSFHPSKPCHPHMFKEHPPDTTIFSAGFRRC